MSIYSRILALSSDRVPTEDVLTEVIAHFFRLDVQARGPSRALVVLWLRSLGALRAERDDVRAVRILTQRTYSAVTGYEGTADHLQSSRPDLSVEVERTSRGHEVVLIESKVGSVEGPDQLRRYAEQLQVRHSDAFGRALVYLTRDPEDKSAEDVCGSAPGVSFVHSRWHSIYRLIRDARPTAPIELSSLYDDVLAFLSSLGMDHVSRFTPADAFALAQVPHAFAFLDETLRAGNPAPSSRFATLLGRVNRPGGFAQVRTHRRHILFRTYGLGHAHFEVLLGYRFPDEGFPRLFLELGSLSDQAGGGHVAQTIRTLDGRRADGLDATWKAYTSSEINWAGASLSLPIEPLLVGDDHAETIRAAFGTLLSELERVMSLPTIAVLPWKSSAEGAEPEDI